MQHVNPDQPSDSAQAQTESSYFQTFYTNHICFKNPIFSLKFETVGELVTNTGCG